MKKLIFGFVIIVLLAGCKETKKVYRWATAGNGLWLRSAPRTPSRKIILIPYGVKVSLLKELKQTHTLAGKTGTWCKLEYKGKIGYAFGGFLSKVKVTQADRFMGTWKDKKTGQEGFTLSKGGNIGLLGPMGSSEGMGGGMGAGGTWTFEESKRQFRCHIMQSYGHDQSNEFYMFLYIRRIISEKELELVIYLSASKTTIKTNYTAIFIKK